jgi:antitoxin component YwqK of YwqJK toxin-antitoxin module
MKKSYLFLILLIVTILSCGDDYERIIISSFPDGTPMQVGVYKWKGNKHIMIKEINYFPNGEIEIEGELNEDGQKHGVWIYWYNNGKKWLEENYQNDVRHGELIEWYMSGDKSFEGEYENGLPAGKWTFWDEDGNKTNQTIYE